MLDLWKKMFSTLKKKVKNRRSVEKQGGQAIDKNRLEHRLDLIQKKISKKVTYFSLAQAKLYNFF